MPTGQEKGYSSVVASIRGGARCDGAGGGKGRGHTGRGKLDREDAIGVYMPVVK